MATIDIGFCGICDARKTSSEAIYWCSECDERLCKACFEHHSISKSSKHHSTIPFEKYNKLPPLIAKITKYCKRHGMEFENFCPGHEKMCCPECISVDHKKCIGLQLLHRVIKNANMPDLLKSVTSSVEEIKIKIKEIKVDREQNLNKIQEQHERYIDKIKKARDDINSNLDALEFKLILDMDDTKKVNETDMKQLIIKLSEKTKVIDDFEQTILAMKDESTDLQKYVGSKMIETEVEEEQKFLQSLFKDGSLNQISLHLEIDSKLSNIESTLNSFGTVSTTEQKPLLDGLESQKNKQAHVLSKSLQQHSNC